MLSENIFILIQIILSNQQYLLQPINKYKEFPDEIFSSIDDQNNHLNEIRNYFKNQLTESWKQFQSH